MAANGNVVNEALAEAPAGFRPQLPAALRAVQWGELNDGERAIFVEAAAAAAAAGPAGHVVAAPAAGPTAEAAQRLVDKTFVANYLDSHPALKKRVDDLMACVPHAVTAAAQLFDILGVDAYTHHDGASPPPRMFARLAFGHAFVGPPCARARRCCVLVAVTCPACCDVACARALFFVAAFVV